MGLWFGINIGRGAELLANPFADVAVPAVPDPRTGRLVFRPV